MSLVQPLIYPEIPKEPDFDGAVTELIYAGHSLAKGLGNSSGQCICGSITTDPEIPSNHHKFCPVARYYSAVEGVRKAAL